MNRQEMFNRAVRGLASQGWVRCVTGAGDCIYNDGEGKHCAWGWVDPGLEAHSLTSLFSLREQKIGIAHQLSADDVSFVLNLQRAHDENKDPNAMQGEFKRLALRHGLIWPNDVPTDQPIKETP